ncbi:hypothetical protein ASPACDRAFT_49260 [Aspergillus aculeatus ATCC 16872]|uniref:Kinesin light chain n=1 Tax=Aspergillus aculeatus (strain ATCC 16872 / CBS 172.66 / WB 5094) TaxID=690307 RepID=A0A1L9X901_ASPA1|nr:uncharacterized protein ASPACDRAFT_49260 [Aspergillus aculeatus ATCC 16872]OJK04913.1 hypothetical protein ASPACDRAFT_49260 [Aspergillus aculeatus ATCC 16872]
MQMWMKGTATTPPLRDILPRSANGQIVFTSRNRKLAIKLASPEVLSIPDVDKDTASKMLETLLVQKGLLRDDLLTLAFLEQLDFFPLAIAQAADYINENDIELSDYLFIFKEKEATAIELMSEEFDSEGNQNPVITTWLISFQQIQELNRLATDYLSFISCISPKDIPQSILPPAPSAKKHADALGLLNAYSFISLHACNSSFSLHRLVHLAVQNWLRKAGFLSLWVQKTMQRLDDIFPSTDPENRALWRSNLPHTLFLQESGEFQKIRHDYGDFIIRHPDSLTSLSILGSLLLYQGKSQEAEALIRKALQKREKVLGLEHPHALRSTYDLALVLQGQGKAKEAEAINQRVLDWREKTLGPDHADTLACWPVLCYQGKYEDAETMLGQALELSKKVLGLEHPQTLTNADNLGLVLHYQGKYLETEAINQQALEGYKTFLVPEHPDTLTSMRNLAYALKGLRKDQDALALMAKCFQLRKKVLGPDHPHVKLCVEAIEKWLYGTSPSRVGVSLHLYTTTDRALSLNPPRKTTDQPRANVLWGAPSPESLLEYLFGDGTL